MFKDYLNKTLLEQAIARVRGHLAKRAELRSSSQDIHDQIESHVSQVNTWSQTISFKDLKGTKLTSDVFVELMLFVTPRRTRYQPSEDIPKEMLTATVESSSRNLLLLGQPGAGKTTSLKFLCRWLLERDDRLPKPTWPLLISLRELNAPELVDPDPLFAHLTRLLGLNISISAYSSVADVASVRRKVCLEMLDALKPLVLIDGFDELAPSRRESVQNDIRRLSLSYSNGLVVVTCRTGDFPYSIDNMDEYEIAPLTDTQVAEFATKWLGPDRAPEFVRAVGSSPFADTALRPLTLAHLCAIFERSGVIPDRPKNVYRKVVALLLEEWDEQRGIKRLSVPPQLQTFTPDIKYDFVCDLATEVSVRIRTPTFDMQQLKSVYAAISAKYDLTKVEASQVVADLEAQTGLIVAAGFQRYEFAHKSLQEFLTADCVVRRPAVPRKNVLRLLPNEMAVAVALSSDPGAYLAEIVLRRVLTSALTDDEMAWLRVFASRLAIERIEFSRNAEAALALTIVYTVYRRFRLFRPDPRSAAIRDYASRDEASKELERLTAAAMDSLGLELIRRFYIQSDTLRDESDEAIVGFVRGEGEPSGLAEAFEGALPSNLYMSADVVDQAEWLER